jgi:transcriptional regulator with XRE-family HTH domain
MSIGLRIKELRAKKNCKQKEFAEIFNIDSSTLSKIEQGKMQPTLQFLMEISSKLEVSVDWILTGKGELYQSEMVIEEPKERYGNNNLTLDLSSFKDQLDRIEKQNLEIIDRLERPQLVEDIKKEIAEKKGSHS